MEDIRRCGFAPFCLVLYPDHFCREVPGTNVVRNASVLRGLKGSSLTIMHPSRPSIVAHFHLCLSDIAASWIPFFDDCHIIFLAPVSCFDQALAEDRDVNRVVRLPYPLFLPLPSLLACRPVSTSPLRDDRDRAFSFLAIGSLGYIFQ